MVAIRSRIRKFALRTLNLADLIPSGIQNTGALWNFRKERASRNPLALSAYKHGVERISLTIASLPKEYAGDKAAIAAIEQPNPNIGEAEFYKLLCLHLLTWGNSYWHIERAGGKLFMYALHPNNLRPQVKDLSANGITHYSFMLLNGKTARYPADEILHIKGITEDGYFGINPANIYAVDLDKFQDTQDWLAKFYRNSAMPSMAIKTQMVEGKQLERTRDHIKDNLQGENALGVLVLSEGSDITPLSYSPSDLGMIDAENSNLRAIARILNLPPSMIGENSRSTFANIYQEAHTYANQTIEPLMASIADQIYAQLGVIIEYDISPILKADRVQEINIDMRLVKEGLMTREQFAERWQTELPPAPEAKPIDKTAESDRV